MEINWSEDNILKINNEIDCFACETVDDKKVDMLRKKIELWLTAIFQSEHFSLLTGTGLTASLTNLAGVSSQRMRRIDFEKCKEKNTRLV